MSNPATVRTLPPGTTLGAFEIMDFIAAGGMGAVYKARNRISGEVRALKVIRSDLACDPRFIDRFAREMKLAGAVEHPHLVRVLEPAMEGRMMFLPMELLRGETLSARLRRETVLGLPVVVSILVPVCRAVAALHAQGIVHRDLKPANIFLARTHDGLVLPKVLDFGAALPPDTPFDADHAVVGTPWYMAPEQARHGVPVDGRADQWALGVVTFQLLTGRRPFESDALVNLRRGTPVPTPEELGVRLPSAITAVVMRALSRDPAHRYASVNDFAAALVNAANALYPPAGSTVMVEPTHPAPPPARSLSDLEPTTSIMLRPLSTPLVFDPRPRATVHLPAGTELLRHARRWLLIAVTIGAAVFAGHHLPPLH